MFKIRKFNNNKFAVTDNNDNIIQTFRNKKNAQHFIKTISSDLIAGNQKIKDIALSNHDLDDLIKQVGIKKANILISDELHNVNDIFNNSGHCIVFHNFDKSQNIGHWLCIIRNSQQKFILVFDSLATDINEINPYLKDILNEYKKEGYDIIVNNIKFQSDISKVCGRYALFIIAMLKNNNSIDEIYELLNAGKQKFKSTDKFLLKMFEGDY